MLAHFDWSAESVRVLHLHLVSSTLSASLSLSLSRATMATTASFFTIASSFSEPRIQIRSSKHTSLSLQYSIPYKANSRSRRRLVVSSVSAPKVELRTGPDDLISSLLSKVCIGLSQIHFQF